jgi:hypothetical protein
MRFIQRSVVQNHFVDCTSRKINETLHARVESGLEELQGSGQVHTEEYVRAAVTADATIPRSFPLHGRVDNGVGVSN